MAVEQINDATNGDRFIIRSTDPMRQGLSFICSTGSQELHREWYDIMMQILQTQQNFLTALQNPQHHVQLTKDS